MWIVQRGLGRWDPELEFEHAGYDRRQFVRRRGSWDEPESDHTDHDRWGRGGGLLSAVPPSRSPNSGSAKGHWAALDGMRAFAVIAVMLFHVQQPHFFLGGYVGVDMFFVLSGFLITSLLISERHQFGTVWMGGFYARRALRLFPALALVIASCAMVVLILGDLSARRHDTLVGIPFATFFVGNWVLGLADSLKLGLLNHTWSLAIEEQFYLVWPLTLLVLVRRMSHDAIAAVLLGLAGAESIARLAVALAGYPWERTYYLTIFHSDGLLIGSALALLFTKHRDALARGWNRPAAAGACVVLVLLAVSGNNTYGREAPIWITLTVLATAAVLINVVTSPLRPLSRVLGSRTAVWIGKRSYGLYLWHIPIYLTLISLVPASQGDRDLACAIGFVATFVAAGLSYRYVERCFSHLRGRFERTTALSGLG
jgi:peptidoglycan/LPS O-acetylase OafA/YrhL